MSNTISISDHLTDHLFMNDLFPFYILLNKDLEILNFGKSTGKAYNLSIGDSLLDNYKVNRPIGIKDYKGLLKNKSALFIMDSLKIKDQKLRGQMYFDETAKICCFLGTPLIKSFESLVPLKLNLMDFAVHDSISQFLFSLQMHLASINDSKQMADKLQKSNARLQETNTKLQEINESLDSFIYKLTHDLRVPALNIGSMLKLLSKNIDFSEEGNKTASKIYEHSLTASSNLIKIIDNFIELSKAEKAGDRKPELCNITEFLEEIEHELNHTILEKEVKIQKKIDYETVFFTPDDLKSVFQNLITNAIKYQPEGNLPIIKIHTKKEGNILKIDVKDNGLGMDLESNAHKLFQIFSRLHVDSRVNGTGIGLYLVKKLITKNNGTITVESALGKGSTFTLYLPIKEK